MNTLWRLLILYLLHFHDFIFVGICIVVSIIARISLPLLICLMLFSGVYTFFGYKIYPPIFISAAGYLLFAINYKNVFYFASEIKFYFFLIIIIFITVAVNQNGNTFFLIFRYIFKSFIVPVGCIVFIDIFYKTYSKEFILNGLAMAILIQFFVVLFQLMFPEFRTAFFSYIELSDNWNSLAEAGHFRTTGLAGLNIYDSSIAYALLLIPFSNWASDFKYINNIKYSLITMILLLLALIAGRTGFIFAIVYFFMTVLRSSRFSFNISFITFLMVVAILVSLLVLGSDGLYDFSRFVFEPIYAYIDTGEIKTESTSELFDSYLFIPWDVSPIIGDGYWAQPSISDLYQYQYKTDSGFLLYYILCGFPGLFFLLTYISWFSFRIYSVIVDITFLSGLLQLKNLLAFLMVFSFFIAVFIKAPANLSERIIPAYLFILYIYESKFNLA